MDIFYPIQILSDWLTYDIVRFTQNTHAADSLNFFIYDATKIIILLIIINYIMAIVRYYLPIEKLRDFLTKRKWYGADHVFASSFGTITPFCSCSSIPLFIGFLEAGVPLGVTLSFLITSPLVNQVAVVLFASLFGWKITIFYVLSAIILGVVGGFVLGHMRLEKYVAAYIWDIKSKPQKPMDEHRISSIERLKLFWNEGWGYTKKILIYVIIGVGVGALIHGYVPSDFFERYITADNLLAVPIAVVAAVPLYANAVGVIPIMESLVAKGIPLGTAMAFMMAIVGLSLPEALILKQVMKLRLLMYFFGITTINIIAIGYLFNLFIR